MYKIAQKAIAENEEEEVEKKRVAGVQSPYNVDYSGVVFNLFSIVQGDGQSQRIGDEVHIKSILARFSIVHGDTNNMVRVVILRWLNDQADATPTNILEGISSTQAPLSPFNWNYRRDFVVLYDNLFACSTYTNANLVEKLYIKRVGKLQFNPAASTVKSNGLYLFAISDSSIAPHPTIQYYTSIPYTDQ